MKNIKYYNIFHSIKCVTLELFYSIFYYSTSIIDKILSSNNTIVNDIVIFSSYGYMPGNIKWDGNSKNIGIGGSELCIINLAESLISYNKNITVYCDCTQDILVNNVKYIQTKKFNYNTTYKNLIIWRHPFIQYFVKSNNIILWIHDGSLMPILHFLNKFNLLTIFIKPKLKIVVPSKFIYDIFYKFTHYKKLYQIKHGIMNEKEFNTESSYRIDNSFIWHVVLNRGIDILLNNFDKITDEFPDAKIHIIGYINSSYNKSANQYINNLLKKAKLKYKDNIIIYGQLGRTNLIKIIKTCDIFCYPSNYIESFSLCTWEAALYGAIPIVYDIGAISEIVNVGGIVIENNNLNLLINTVLDLLRNKDKKEDLRKNIKEKMQYCDWNHIANIWLKDIIE